jgi:ABC-type sugar transport system permease subunit
MQARDCPAQARVWRSAEGMLVIPALLFYIAIYLYPLSRIAAWSFFDRGVTLKFYRA